MDAESLKSAMNAESWKTIVSAASAVIAIASAYLAHRAKVQTRTDIFNSHRDSLVLAMADNDISCEHLGLQLAFAREQLERLLPRLTDESAKAQAADFLSEITDMEPITHALDGREFDEEKLDALGYSEEGVATMRRIERGEQVNAKRLASKSYDLIFERIDRFISRQDERTPAAGRPSINPTI